MFAILGSVIPRITPAYAGKRHSVFGYGRNTRDHPRVCGEKCEPKHDLFNEQGSPPRMRGKETAGQHCRRLSGITPAYAGKRPCSCRAMRRYGDHPRVCGEKTVMHNVAANKKGSPPRMRGKDRQTSALAFGIGITPAYAGKSRSLNWTSSTAWDHPRVCGEKPPHPDRRPE